MKKDGMSVDRIELEKDDPWPGAVSDGLTLRCKVCRCIPRFDYVVSDELWNTVVRPIWRTGAICLPCLDKIATAAGHDISRDLIQVQFTGIGKTVVLIPAMTFIYEER